MARRSVRLFQINTPPVISSTRFWYGTCVNCKRKSNNTIPEEINKVICVNCNKSIEIVYTSEKPSLNESGLDCSSQKCRLCLNVITSTAYPIWGVDGIDYCEKLYLCCSLQLSQDDDCPKNICNDCALRLDNAYEFRLLCLKNNEIFTSIEMKEESDISFMNVTPDVDTYLDSELDNNAIDSTDLAFSETESQYECTKCPMICYSEAEFRLHRKSHSDKNNVHDRYIPKIYCQVNNCKEKFKTFDDRIEHVKTEHKDIDNSFKFICPFCAQPLKTFSKFKYHINILHLDENVACNECGKILKGKNLKAHQRNVHLKKFVSCPKCDLSILKSSLSRHLRQIHDNNHKFSCQFCDKKFSNKWNLKSHVRTHTGEMPYKCPDCDMPFSHRVIMKNHRLKVHKINMFDVKKDSQNSKLN